MTRVTHQAVRDTLAACGPLTSADVAEFFPDSTHQEVSAVLSSMRTAKVKRVYIESWVREAPGRKRAPRPVYALGDKPDAKAPKPEPGKLVTRRYRQRQRAAKPAAPTSVFDLARFL